MQLATCLVILTASAALGSSVTEIHSKKTKLDWHKLAAALNEPVELLGFSYSQCGGSMVNISSLSVTPDPLNFPGPLTVEAKFSISRDLTQPLKADLYIAKKILGTYIEIPCISGVGSCTYDDVCAMLAKVPQCPDALIKLGIDCKCPLKKNSYDLPTTSFSVEVGGVPSGDYKARVNLSHNGTAALCLEVEFSLK